MVCRTSKHDNRRWSDDKKCNALSTWQNIYQVTMTLCHTILSVGHTCLSVFTFMLFIIVTPYLIHTSTNLAILPSPSKFPTVLLSRHRGFTLCSASQNNAAGGYTCGENARNCLSLSNRQWTQALVLCTGDDGVFLLPSMPQGLSKTRVARSERLAVSDTQHRGTARKADQG